MNSSAFLATISILISFLSSSAFTNIVGHYVPISNHVSETQRVAFFDSSFRRKHQITLHMSGEEETEAVEEETSVEGEEVEKITEEKEEEPKEDPEITALKEEIASLETDLKSKRVKASSIEKMADDYTDNGYRRKCAEMENMRRLRSQASESSLITSRASILQNFLPIGDTLKSLDESYADNEFTKGYGALAKDFANCLKNLDVAEFVIEAGSVMDSTRCVAISEENSDTVKAGVVVRVQRNGYEVKGNVIQFAEVVVSLGSGKEAEKKGSDEEAVEEEKK